MDEGRTDDLVFIVFDLLYLNDKSTATLPLIERKERLRTLFKRTVHGLRFSDHMIGNGPRFREQACKMKVEGTISKRVDRAYAPGDRGLWLKTKCLNREEFIVVGRPSTGGLVSGPARGQASEGSGSDRPTSCPATLTPRRCL
jgi:ATP-dependent DNA ligase